MWADRKRSDCLWGLRAYNLQPLHWPDSIPGNYQIVMEILSCQYTETMELTIILTFLLCFDSWWNFEKSFINIFNIGEIVDSLRMNFRLKYERLYFYTLERHILIHVGTREDNAGLYLIRDIVLCSVYPHRLLMTLPRPELLPRLLGLVESDSMIQQLCLPLATASHQPLILMSPPRLYSGK